MESPTPIAQACAALTPDKGIKNCSPQLPLPGVIIFVHGVNSDGEWYEAAEDGLCRGLNARLARQQEQLAVPGVNGGTLAPVTYLRELDDDGFVNDKRNARTFITNDPNHSPVIRFRWGYKAFDKEAQEFGDGIWLNEHNYWGGGPFANGCTSLPDLWSDGLNPRLFLWLTAQHLNPVPGRDVYACPPRHYYAHAGRRLADLVELVRQKQPDVPITIVCHSQGNMIGLAAAFYGAETGALADNYVLANAPYSLREEGIADNWVQRSTVNAKGESGHQTQQARRATFETFLKLIGGRRGSDQAAAEIDRSGANPAPKDGSPGYSAANEKYTTKGYVTLYCNPHDQVISATTVQGIGWRGVGKGEMTDKESRDILRQRVWAQNWPLGKSGDYHFWNNHYRKPTPGKDSFWHPESPPVRYQLSKGLEASPNVVAKFLTVATTLLVVPVRALSHLASAKIRINADPPPDWTICINAPALPRANENYLPRAQRLGRDSPGFDEGGESPAAERDAQRAYAPGDPYGAYPSADPAKERPQGNAESEAQLRYEHRARLRMKAEREGRSVEGQKPEDPASDEWISWSREQITEFLKEGIDQNATDHSTIMTHSENAAQVLAYDVAVGKSTLSAADWAELRTVADWRLLNGLRDDHPAMKFSEYLEKGMLDDTPLHQHDAYKKMPAAITDERAWKPAPAVEYTA